ncbi:MAG: hypothetical protein ACYC1D_06175 [Acidimicrobiales bacterium]
MTRAWREAFGVVLAASVLLGVAGCGSSTPRAQKLSDSQIQRWLTAVATYDAVIPGGASLCYLLRFAEVRKDLSHPPGEWYVLGNTALVTNGALKSLNCDVYAGRLGPSPGRPEAGVELFERPPPSLHFGTTAPYVRVVDLPGTTWELAYSAWPNRLPTVAQMQRIEHDVVVNLLADPPSTLSSGRYLGPHTTLHS